MSDLSPQVKRPYSRRTYLVDRRFQLRFALFFAGGVLLLGLLVGLLTYFPAAARIQRQLYSPHIRVAGSGELLSPLFFWLNAGFVLTLVLLALFLAAWHLRRTTGSLGRLAGCLQAMAAGKIPPPIHFRRRDPLYDVALEFNRMANALRDRRLRLDSHVQAAVDHLQHCHRLPGEVPSTERGQMIRELEKAVRELSLALDALPVVTAAAAEKP
jgi:HAMP domain-containing protein